LLYGKKSFEVFKILATENTDLKIILLDYQNNDVAFKHDEQYCKKF